MRRGWNYRLRRTRYQGLDAGFESVANLSTPLSGSAPGPTYLSLTPGYRVQIHGGWFFLAGLEVPVTSHGPFATQPIFLLLKDY